ncbi:hypothetical protein DY000_02015900 [Brassica cretica]|uniref:Uncharacterized protein n=1 Tax=Brassica cretica TaxID=69181 RepID=A0ABQ7CY62_BRACR|nr:hypothetical protein DY000_02015900 [Brassica cretica]
MPILLKIGQSASREEAVKEMKDCRSITQHWCRSTVMPEYGLSGIYDRLKPRTHTKLPNYPSTTRNPIYEPKLTSNTKPDTTACLGAWYTWDRILQTILEGQKEVNRTWWQPPLRLDSWKSVQSCRSYARFTEGWSVYLARGSCGGDKGLSIDNTALVSIDSDSRTWVKHISRPFEAQKPHQLGEKGGTPSESSSATGSVEIHMSIDTAHLTLIDTIHPTSIDTTHQPSIDTVHPPSTDTVHLPSDTTCLEAAKVEVLILTVDENGMLRDEEGQSTPSKQRLAASIDTVHVTSIYTAHLTSIDTAHLTSIDTAHLTSIDTAHLTSIDTAHLTLIDTVHPTSIDTADQPSIDTVHLPSTDTVHPPSTDTVHPPSDTTCWRQRRSKCSYLQWTRMGC